MTWLCSDHEARCSYFRILSSKGVTTSSFMCACDFEILVLYSKIQYFDLVLSPRGVYHCIVHCKSKLRILAWKSEKQLDL